MKINVNLASHPYEDVSRFYMKWIPLLAVLAILAMGLSAKALLTYRDSRQVENQITERRREIAKLQQEQLSAQSLLNKPENSGTRDQAQFLNSLFTRKAFSWTQVMADLEKIMPAQVQVVSIRPQLDADGRLQFTLDVATSHRDSAIELVRRMEMSPRFQEAQIKSESSKEDSPGAGSAEQKVRVEILALYIPDLKHQVADSAVER